MWRFDHHPDPNDPTKRHAPYALFKRREEAMERLQPDGRRLLDYGVDELRALPRERQEQIAAQLETTVQELQSSKWRKGRGLAWGRAMVRPKDPWNVSELAKVGVQPVDEPGVTWQGRNRRFLQCIQCGTTWERQFDRRGFHKQDYWRCPQGCNRRGNERDWRDVLDTWSRLDW